MVTDDQQWYVQKGSRVQGPYSTQEVGRFLLLGRVRNTDRVSRDGELWEPVTQVPELIPEELLDLESPEGWQRFIQARSATDDRQEAVTVVPDRRSTEVEITDELRDEWHARSPQGPAGNVLPWSLFGITLVALGVVLYLNSLGTTTL